MEDAEQQSPLHRPGPAGGGVGVGFAATGLGSLLLKRSASRWGTDGSYWLRLPRLLTAKRHQRSLQPKHMSKKQLSVASRQRPWPPTQRPFIPH